MSKLPPVAHEDAGTEDPLIFQWESRPRKWRRLSLILLGSLFAHAMVFYLLQVAYTPTGSLQPPAAQIVLIAPEDPAQKAALAQWLQMADPALMTSASNNDASGVLEKIGLRYKPSYAGAPPGFKTLEPVNRESNLAVPERSRPFGPILFVPDELSPAPAKRDPAPPLSTRLVFRGPIKPLVPTSLPPLKFTISQSNRPLEPTSFLVGVRPDGGTPLIFRQPATSDTAIGDATLDEQARAYLTQLRFENPTPAATNEGIQWSWATFYWGREIYH